MSRAYHDQNLKKILCVITDYAIAAYRMKYPHEKKIPVQTGYDLISRASPKNVMVML